MGSWTEIDIGTWAVSMDGSRTVGTCSRDGCKRMSLEHKKATANMRLSLRYAEHLNIKPNQRHNSIGAVSYHERNDQHYD